MIEMQQMLYLYFMKYNTFTSEFDSSTYHVKYNTYTSVFDNSTYHLSVYLARKLSGI